MPRPPSPASDHSVFGNTQTRQGATPYRAPHHPAAHHSLLYHAEHYQHLEHTQHKGPRCPATTLLRPTGALVTRMASRTAQAHQRQRTTISIHLVTVGQRVSPSQQAGLPGLSWNCCGNKPGSHGMVFSRTPQAVDRFRAGHSIFFITEIFRKILVKGEIF